MNRRDFLGASCLSAIGMGLSKTAIFGNPRIPDTKDLLPASQVGSKSKIARIELFPLRYPMTGYFKFFTGPHGSAGRAAVIIKITADDGTIGWGQSLPIAKWSYETLETAAVVLQEYLIPVFIGRDPTDIKGAHLRWIKRWLRGFQPRCPSAVPGSIWLCTI